MRKHAIQSCVSALRASWTAAQPPAAPASRGSFSAARPGAPHVGAWQRTHAPAAAGGAAAGGGLWCPRMCALPALAAGGSRGMAMTNAARKRREMGKTVLNGELRESGTEFGKHEARQLRAGGWVPGRVQTRTGDVLGVKLKYEDIKQVAFDRFLKNTIYTVVLVGQDPIKCLVREMQVHVRTCVCVCVCVCSCVCASMCVCVCVCVCVCRPR